jgi:HD-GYP domain-containing protein (c-di-GMP phosphodiesterase class II)
MPAKRIPLSALKIGMYVAGFDLSWFRSPFLRHRFLVQTEGQIQQLRRVGIHAVDVDPSLGLDPDALPPDSRPAERTLSADHTGASAKAAPKSLETLSQELALAREARQQLLQSVESLFDRIATTGPVGSSDVTLAVWEITIVTKTLTNPAVFMAMNEARGADPMLSAHALAVCTLSMIMGQAFDFNPLQLQELATGALLHDTGLIQLPPPLRQRIHDTSRSLTVEERSLFESHPRQGAVELEREGGFSLEVRRIVAEHHATLDGKGYPRETRPNGTAKTSRIVMVADRYDELVTGFGRATPLDPYQALQRLYQEGLEGKLDEQCVSLFIRRVGVYPVYSRVELTTGEQGVITDLHPDTLHLPIVTVTHDRTGAPLPSPCVIDLARQEGSPARSIARVMDTHQALR